MATIIPLSPKTYQWVSSLDLGLQQLIGWMLTEVGVYRSTELNGNEEVTSEHIERTAKIYFHCDSLGDLMDYALAFYDPKNDYRFSILGQAEGEALMDKLVKLFYQALPYIFWFTFGLACGLG